MVDDVMTWRSLPKLLVVTFLSAKAKFGSWTLAAATKWQEWPGKQANGITKETIIMIYFLKKPPYVFKFGIKEIMKNQISLDFRLRRKSYTTVYQPKN
jgi:hypothetical protein